MVTEYDLKKSEIYADEMKLDVATLRPIIIDLTKNTKGKKVLDYGCGSGRFSKLMAEYGANVIATDISKSQIELAKKINSHKNILYEVGGETILQKFDNNLFDVILMNMVFPSLDGTEQAEYIIKEIGRILKTNGTLIISILHPLFLHPIQKVNDRATDFKFENYFKEGHNYSAEAITTKNRIMNFRETHFSLNFLSKLLEKNNFYIKKIREGNQVPEMKVYVPIYLVFECIKLDI